MVAPGSLIAARTSIAWTTSFGGAAIEDPRQRIDRFAAHFHQRGLGDRVFARLLRIDQDLDQGADSRPTGFFQPVHGLETNVLRRVLQLLDETCNPRGVLEPPGDRTEHGRGQLLGLGQQLRLER